MRPLKSLTFEAVRDVLASTFKRIPDRRHPQRVSWELHAVLMSAFAMFFFQHPSLLSFQQRMKKKLGQSNLERVFELEDLPSDTQMREILDGVATEPLRQLLPQLFERMRRTGWTARLVTKVAGQNYYTVALDGSQYFHSTQIECPGCLRREDSQRCITRTWWWRRRWSKPGRIRFSRWMPRKCGMKMGSRSRIVRSRLANG